jgi:hypothetical protein
MVSARGRTSRGSQRRESVSVPIERQRPGVAALGVRCDTACDIHRDGRLDALKGQEATAQGKRAARRASPWVNRPPRHPSPEGARQRSRMTRSSQSGAVPRGGEAAWVCAAPSGLVGSGGRLTQGGAPRGLGACPGLSSFAPLGLGAPNQKRPPTPGERFCSNRTPAARRGCAFRSMKKGLVSIGGSR